ncbi:MAG TPA: transglutaminase family protein, partial [Methanobacterium sp.]
DLVSYTLPTTNCQSNDPAIVALAYSLASGANSPLQVGTRIFNWVRDNISYEFYYDSQKGAVGTLNSRGGNCCDTVHLLIALARAMGIPAEYVHGTCYFTASGAWYGHVFARLYINGVWYDADAISSRNSLGVINNWDTTSWTFNGVYKTLPF